MEQLNATSSCSQCKAVLHSTAFPALTKANEHVAAEQIDAKGQAGCFYHPEKQASVSCAHCGRFLCTLCDLDISGQHICSSCLSSGKDQQGVTIINKGSQRYDMIAMAYAIWPLLLFTPLCVIGAPLSIYYSIRYYNKPLSIVPVGHGRFIVASLLALFQLAGIALLSYYLLTA
jgi:hypothetical protein